MFAPPGSVDKVEPEALVEQFVLAAAHAGLPNGPGNVQVQVLPAPHQPTALRHGCSAVYVFALAPKYGASCPAGPGRALKVGHAGPNSNARFQYQHYNGHASSTLAGSLVGLPVLWLYLGISTLSREDAAEWIMDNTTRVDFFIRADADYLRRPLEHFIRAYVGPVFEGSRSV